MGIEAVNVPPPGKNMTPGAKINTNPQHDQYWRDKVAEARAMREYEEEQQNLKALRNPATPQDPPIKMSGAINLGTIDFQAQAREAKEAEASRAAAAEARTQKLEEENAKLKNDLMATTITNMQTNLTAQIQKLQQDLAAGKGSPKSIADQLKEITESANLLGYVRPDMQQKPPVVATATDAAVSLEMLRLQLEDKRKERDFAWQMEKDRRQFQIQLRQLDAANKLAIAEAGGKEAQRNMILKVPELLGGAIAKGLLASKVSGIAEQPRQPYARPRPGAPPPNNMGNNAPPSMPPEPAPAYPNRVSAGPGESGTIECPECGSPIAIGPTAETAVCASCSYEIEVVRTGAPNA